MFKRFLFFIFLIGLLPSCTYKNFSKNIVIKKIKNPIFISMVQNSLAFENISPILYESVFKQYLRLGYRIATDKEYAFNLNIKIKTLSPIENFISKDLLVYNVRVNLVVICELFNLQNILIKKKKFELSRLVSIPDDPLNSSSYFDYEYRQLISYLSIKIERYFRKYLFEK